MATTIFLVNPVNFGSSFTNDYSMQFDGVDEYIDNGVVSEFNSSTSFSVSFWFKFGANTLDRIFEGKIISATDRILLYHNTGGQVIAQLFNGSSRAASFTNGYDTDWHHLTLVYDGSQPTDSTKLKMFLDGVQKILTFSGTGSVPSSISASTANMYIGGATNPFTGNFDEVSIFNYSLTSTQVTSLYNSGTPTDLDNTSGVTAPVHWWRMGDGSDSYDGTNWTINDVGTTGGNNGTSANMEVGDRTTDTP